MNQEQHADGERVEARSSVKLALNAKGEVQIDVRAIAGEEPALLDEARRRAVATFNELRREYPRLA